MKSKSNLIVGQSGGPTVVINQSLLGVILEALKYDKIDGIYGMQNGVEGFINEKIVDLRKENKKTLEKVATTPGAALGSCRFKPKREDCEKIFEICKKYDIRYFFYIGGNDSAETAGILNEIATAANYDITLIHIPKTIDNDLRETDHCPGYGSAAKYVALLFKGDNFDNASLKGIKINVVMGRNAGWLTAASCLAREKEGDGPHLIYIPERPISLDKFISDVDNVYKKYGRALIAVSEGLRNIDGELMLKSKLTEQDAFGNIQLSGSGALGDFLAAQIKSKLGEKLRVRSDTLGYAQRSFFGIVSETDAKEAYAVGQYAVKFAMKGEKRGSVIIKRKKGKKYEVEYDIVPLEKVAKVTKNLPDEFIKGENDVTEKFIEYARPLVGKIPEAGRLNFYPIK